MGPKAALLHITKVKQLTQFQYKKLPIIYLGIPLHKGWVKVCLFDDVLQCMCRVLHGWEMRALLKGGHLMLIKSVLQSLSLHLFQAIQPPKLVLEGMERLMNQFF